MMSNKKKSLIIKNLSGTKLISWPNSILSKMKIKNDSRAGIIVDKNGTPQLFIFDTPAFLDVLSTIDESLVDRLSDSEYHSKSANPAGWLIDEIESKLPPNPQFVQSIKDALKEAENKGWISFTSIKKNLGLV